MASPFPIAARIVVLPIAVWAVFVVYGHSLGFAEEIIATPKERAFVPAAFLLHEFLAAAATSIAFSYPLARVDGSAAVVWSLAVAAPVVALRLPELLDPGRHPHATVISAFGLFAYVMLLVAGTWLASRRLARRAGIKAARLPRTRSEDPG